MTGCKSIVAADIRLYREFEHGYALQIHLIVFDLRRRAPVEIPGLVHDSLATARRRTPAQSEFLGSFRFRLIETKPNAPDRRWLIEDDPDNLFSRPGCAPARTAVAREHGFDGEALIFRGDSTVAISLRLSRPASDSAGKLVSRSSTILLRIELHHYPAHKVSAQALSVTPMIATTIAWRSYCKIRE